jgi:hypothetical protein
MRPFLFVPSGAIIIFLANSFLFGQITPDDSYYLDQAAKLAPTSEVEQDEIIRFEADVTGDGSVEVFYTKASLRDGKQGYLWSIFLKGGNGTLRPIGDVTFAVEVFKPSEWKSDDKSKGFYTYFPSGGSRGSLAFFEVTASGVTHREHRKIEPSGADKLEFDDLFAAQLKGESPKLDLKRTTLPKQQGTSTPENVLGAEHKIQDTTRAPKPSPVMQPPAPKKAPNANQSPALGDEVISSTTWSIIAVLIVAVFGLLGLVLKKRK